MVRDNQTSMANRGVIQRMMMQYYQPGTLGVYPGSIGFTSTDGVELSANGLNRSECFLAIFKFKKMVESYNNGIALSGEQPVTLNNRDTLQISTARPPFISDFTSTYLAYFPVRFLNVFLGLENSGIIGIEALLGPRNNPDTSPNAGLEVSFERKRDTKLKQYLWEAKVSSTGSFGRITGTESLEGISLKQETYFIKGRNGFVIPEPEYQIASSKLKESYRSGWEQYGEWGAVLDRETKASLRLVDPKAVDAYERGYKTYLKPFTPHEERKKFLGIF